MPNLALADLVVPYLLRGENLGAQHAALSVIRVVQWETVSDDFGIAIRGRWCGCASGSRTATTRAAS